MDKTNIVLIGMPSSGKSTVGRQLSEDLNMDFLDTDIIIKESENRELREIVNNDGLERFLEIQERAILGIQASSCVIATGGGVVHGEVSMAHLKKHGIVIYLETPFLEISARITEGRRFARNKGQSFQELFNKRAPLYRKYADIIIDCTEKSVNDICREIGNSLTKLM